MTPGYVEALSIPLTDGRVFTTADTTSPVIAMLVNEMFARAYLNNGRPPVGRRFIGMLPNLLGRDHAVVHVVGVVDDVLLDSLDGQPQPQIYLPLGSVGVDLRRAATLVVKTDGEPEALVPLLTRTVQAIEPTAAVSRTGALTARVSASADEPRFFAFVITAFGILALCSRRRDSMACSRTATGNAGASSVSAPRLERHAADSSASCSVKA